MNDNTKAIILRWEKWRIAYNLILLVEALWFFREHLTPLFTQYTNTVVLFALGANICYCLGPLSEICVRALWRLGSDRTRYQPFLKGLFYFTFSVGLLFSMWWVWMWTLRGVPKFEEARIRAMMTEIRGGIGGLSTGLDFFEADCGRYPTTEEGLVALIQRPPDLAAADWRGPYLGNATQIPLDPWKNKYTYTCPGKHNLLRYDLQSMGPDMTLDTEDDFTNW